MAGTNPNQPSTDGKHRIKLSSEREQFTYHNRHSLGLDDILPKNHDILSYKLNAKGQVCEVQLKDLSLVTLERPIPRPSGDRRILVIDTVGYEEHEDDRQEDPGHRLDRRENPQLVAGRLFLDIKIGHYTKSGQQFELEGAHWFMRQLKWIEHDIKDRNRDSRKLGYDIDAGNLARFNASYNLAEGKGGASQLARAMIRTLRPLKTIEAVTRHSPVTFVGASVFIVLNLRAPEASDAKIIDLDHPIIFEEPADLGPIPRSVMTGDKMQGGRQWNQYKAKWKASFSSGMTNFCDWYSRKVDELQTS